MQKIKVGNTLVTKVSGKLEDAKKKIQGEFQQVYETKVKALLKVKNKFPRAES